jgi:hypothetical protein
MTGTSDVFCTFDTLDRALQAPVPIGPHEAPERRFKPLCGWRSPRDLPRQELVAVGSSGQSLACPRRGWMRSHPWTPDSFA